jgi:hypothetical protein
MGFSRLGFVVLFKIVKSVPSFNHSKNSQIAISKYMDLR